MSRFRVVICGGGIAAAEGLLRLRALAGDALDITLVSAEAELRYRPVAVQEPFSRPAAQRYRLDRIARRAGAELVNGSVERVDVDTQEVHTTEGGTLPYDAALVAVGARAYSALEHATVFDDAHADDTYRGLVQDVEGGYTRSVALIVPEGPAWPLPVYELALMTAERAASMGEEGAGVVLITPEPAPLAAFGEEASRAVANLLERARIQVHTGATAEVPEPRRVVLQPGGEELSPERVVALPELRGPGLRGLPSDSAGFVPIDDRCLVPGTAERVFAAGDAADFPIKHGGLGAQMADVAAAGIATFAGADAGDGPARLEPVIHGVLYTGEEPLYLIARVRDGKMESEVRSDRPWPADEKVHAEELGPLLRELA